MSKDKHLTPEEIAQCAEAINNGRYEILPASLRNHLSACEECAGEVMMVSDVSQAIDEDLDLNKKAGKNLKIKSLYIGTIAAAAAIVLFFIVPLIENGKDAIQHTGYVVSTGDIPVFVVDETQDTVYFKDYGSFEIAVMNDESKAIEGERDIREVAVQESEKKEELLAEYKPNENLEQLYENLQGAYRSREVEVNTPPTINYENNDSLSWSNPKEKKFYIEFFNNKGEEVEAFVVENNKASIPELPGGLYYWKLINEDFDLLFVGKIIVE